MAWSTREIAELGGTSLRAVRHHDEVGLLDEPERRTHGDKQYGVAHLLRVVRSTRLTDLGFSLPQIASTGDTADHPAEALRTLDAELAVTIEGLQRVRVELGLILRQAAPTDLPTEFAWADMLQNLPDDPAASDFDHLPADADEATRQNVAEGLVPYVHTLHARFPEMQDARADTPRGSRFAGQTVDRAIDDVVSPAQLGVLTCTMTWVMPAVG
ncbi:MAG: MerR family transcriptional regulator [Pseudonocardia sp.]|nr:MerR family transcriptional regulator [Pseudonocardia sp.]